jgi:cytochrome c2
VRQLEGSGGVIEWTSPTGRQYLVQPERKVPGFKTTSMGATAALGDPPF